MGMFDKDKKMAPDGYLTDYAPVPQLKDNEERATGPKFALMGAKIVDEQWPTDDGTTPMAHLAVCGVTAKGEPDGEIKIVSALGDSICNKIKDKEDGDLPAIVETQRVKNKKDGFSPAFVIHFVSGAKGTEYTIPERG